MSAPLDGNPHVFLDVKIGEEKGNIMKFVVFPTGVMLKILLHFICLRVIVFFRIFQVYYMPNIQVSAAKF